jgi:hypothetical protein
MSSAASSAPVRFVKVLPLEDFRVRLEDEFGSHLVLSLKELIFRREAFWRCRRPRYFGQITLDPLGGLQWPEGEDIAPECLLRYAEPACTSP